MNPEQLYAIIRDHNIETGEYASVIEISDLAGGLSETGIAPALDYLVATRSAIPHLSYSVLSPAAATVCNRQRRQDIERLAPRIADVHGVKWANVTPAARDRFLAAAQVALDYVGSIS